jgi:TldD protein
MPQLDFPRSFESVRQTLPDLVATLEQRSPYGSALVTRTAGLSISLNKSEQQIAQIPPTQGLVLTAYDGEALVERAVAELDPDQLRAEALALAAGLRVRPGAGLDPGAPLEQSFVNTCVIDPASLTLTQKIDRCREIQARLAALDPRIINVVVNYNEWTELKAFANRTRNLSQRLTGVRMMIYCFVNGGGPIQYDLLSRDGTGGWELLDLADEDLHHLRDSALRLLHAEHIEPGTYDVVTSPGVTGTIAHESFGHGVEVDMFLKGRARAADYIDQVVAAPQVSIYDDPSVAGSYGSYFFDDEGVSATSTEIVRDGVFLRGITDLYSASKLGIQRSANGRRESFQRKVYPRMSCTFFGRGMTPVADIIAGVDSGIYLERWMSGMEDPKGWGIQVICQYGREIKAGRITDRVFSPIGVSGYVPEVLQSISAVGDDFVLDGGGCAKGHKEYVRVSSGGPHLRLRARLG